jgi:hypothetical protein
VDHRFFNLPEGGYRARHLLLLRRARAPQDEGGVIAAAVVRLIVYGVVFLLPIMSLNDW